jgi:NAD+ synthetase
VATITRVMCDLVVQEVVAGELQVQSDLKRLSPSILAEILACAVPVGSATAAAAATASTAVSLQEEDRGRSKSIAAGGAGGAASVPVIRGSTPPRVSSPPPADRTGEGENQLVVFRRMDSYGAVDEFEGTWRPVHGKLKELAKKLCGTILHTTYIATVNNHSDTRSYAQELSECYGSYHCLLHIDTIVTSVLSCLGAIQGSAAAVGRIISPRYKSQGGCDAEDLALQNIQARLRMVMSYLCAALLPWIRGGCGQTSNGFLLVLGSGNVDEALRGYFTKYDCSSADLNPIGGICKKDLKKLLVWAADIMDCPAVGKILVAPPTAELRPLSLAGPGSGAGSGSGTSRVVLEQTDEEDMGMSYDDLSVFGYLRKVRQCGPLSMFHKLCEQWRLSFSPRVIADKVKHFFKFYAINRHKLTTLTPSYHAENYSPDDNRYDFRPFLYPVRWSRSFANIDACVADLEMRPAIGRGI